MKHVFACVVVLLSSLLLTAARGDGKDEVVTPKETDLIDKTEDYKGKTIKMVLTYGGRYDLRMSIDVQYNKTLKTSPQRFRLGNKEIWIDCLPGGKGSTVKKINDLPDLSAGDQATITFVCEDGKLGTGNRMIDIKRK